MRIAVRSFAVVAALLSTFCTGTTSRSEVSLVPLPASASLDSTDRFVVKPTTAIVVDSTNAEAVRLGQYLADLIATPTLPAPKVQSVAASSPSIRLALSSRGDMPTSEQYTLKIAAAGVEITASGPAGLFYGIQTLRQLMPVDIEFDASRPTELPIRSATISDNPRFVWRAAMLDVARHFFSVDDVKRYIDLIAMLKLNRLHLHLADDQGWRIEIKSWPELTTRGATTSVGGGAGGFYTQEQFGDIVGYARDRFVTIVPEIDMPGHTNAALASYAELNCDNKIQAPYTGIEVGFIALCVDKDITYRFIDDVVREIAAMSPGPYFHVGGDEVKLLTADQYRRFVERVQTIVQSHGKKMIGWDEVAAVDLKPDSIVQHWRPQTSPRDAVAKGIKVILSPAERAYLDMKYDRTTPIGLDWAARIEVKDSYDWEPATAVEGVPESAILGLEAPLWSETTAHMHEVEFLAFPRIAAIAELAWTPARRRGWPDFRRRLAGQAPRWSALGINFYRSPQIPWADARN